MLRVDKQQKDDRRSLDPSRKVLRKGGSTTPDEKPAGGKSLKSPAPVNNRPKSPYKGVNKNSSPTKELKKNEPANNRKSTTVASSGDKKKEELETAEAREAREKRYTSYEKQGKKEELSHVAEVPEVEESLVQFTSLAGDSIGEKAAS